MERYYSQACIVSLKEVNTQEDYESALSWFKNKLDQQNLVNRYEAKKIYDPVMITLEKLKKEYDNE